jgi:hypothetical protein
MLKLRRGNVVSADPLEVELDGERRRAWADPELVGEVREGDEVVVNTEALDLGLGSGGFDVVHVNLTRGLGGAGASGPHVMKLNYTSLQHPVSQVERDEEEVLRDPATEMPVLVLPLHGHLAPAAFAAAAVRPGLRVGYVQTAGGALPGRYSLDVALLRDRGLLCGHVTVAPCFGAEHEAISVAGALDAAASSLGWDAAIAGPGPGILGSATRLGHGGMAALDTAHAALALDLPTLLAPRLSGADPRERHRGLSHHTATVLELLLDGVTVPVPEGNGEAIAALEPLLADRHRLSSEGVDLEAYSASGLPSTSMGRTLAEDPSFFAAALAAGAALARVVR